MMYPMYPTPLVKIPDDLSNWIVQYKYNGWRVVIDTSGDAYTRRGNSLSNWDFFLHLNWQPMFPVDCELVHEKEASYNVPRLKKSDSGYLYVFDIMIENTVLTDRLNLIKLMKFPNRVKLAPYFNIEKGEDINSLYDQAIDKGHEGIVLKKKDSYYEIGKMSQIFTPDWLKLKSRVRLTKADK